MEHSWWLGIILLVVVAIAAIVWFTVKICEFRYYGSPILWWEMLKGRRYYILGVAANRSGDMYAIVQDKRKEVTHFVWLPSDLNLNNLKVGDPIKVRREVRPGEGVFIALYRALRKKGRPTRLVRCYSMMETR